jgi:hypothetical protein
MNRILIIFFFINLVSSLPVYAQVSCANEVQDIKLIIANERFDDYTQKQIDALVDDLEKALSGKNEFQCVKDVQKLKHILHLDH